MNNRKSEDNKNKLLYDPDQARDRRAAFSMAQNFSEEDEIEEELNDESEIEQMDDSEESSSPSSNALDNAKEFGKGQVKQATKQVAQKAVSSAKVAIAKVGSKIVAFIAANPWILAVLAVVIIIFLIIISFAGVKDKSNGYYSQECNFNASSVTLSSCDVESPEILSLSLKDYVIGTTYSFISDYELSDDAIKAIMIIVKTNALSYGGYDNASKNLTLDTCDYEYQKLNDSNEEYEKYNNLYTDIENYLYLSSSYNGTIDSLDAKNALSLDENLLNQIILMNAGYIEILNNLYNKEINDKTIYTENLFVGDSRIEEMKDYGVIESSKAIYGRGYGYNWFIGSGNFSGGNTNAVNGAISKINEKSNDDTNYNIIIWLGLNDLEYVSANTYFDEYYKLASGTWSNYNLFIVAVGPVLEDISSISNSSIDNFNNEMKSYIQNSGLSNLKYIDINYNINNYDSSGVHYSSQDYSGIYSQIMRKVGSSTSVSSGYYLYNLDDHCEFITIDKNGESNACEEMSISSTSLSKSEFVNKVQMYYSNNNSSYAKVFSDNAETIYDLAVSNGINPEVIVVRASLEGYSPASQGYPNYNNYWGIRCYNGQKLSSCASYNSFDSGVLGFINTISKYDSLSSMLKKYAYIGSYWYNPGNAGSGGCYYFPYIKKYMSSSRANEVSIACQSSNACQGSSCLKTNDEDQLAYSMWQVEKMANQRNSMFNMSSDLCDGYSQSCTIYSQSDSRWKNVKLGNSDSTMGSSGCAVTSIAIGISCSGTDIKVANFDAGKLIETMNDGACFADGGYIYWGCSAISKIAPNVRLLYNQKGIKSYSNQEKKDIINEYNGNNGFVIVHFVNSAHKRGHYVVVTSINGDNLIVKDPSGGKVSTIPINIIDQIVAYSS